MLLPKRILIICWGNKVDMALKGTFEAHAEGVKAAMPLSDAPVLEDALPGISQQWSANATSQTELLAREGEGGRSGVSSHHKSATQKKREENSRAALTQAEAIRQAYEQFQDSYDDAMAFYGDADQRLDDLENRINERLHDMESETELLTDENGIAVYRDENGGFYTIKDGQRTAITDAEDVATLREKSKAIEASGQRVRTESEQSTFLQLQAALTDTMDLRRDAHNNRAEAEEWKRRVDKDHTQAPEGNKRIQEGRADTEKRIKELEEKVDGLDVKVNNLDQQHSHDQGPVATTVSEWKTSIPSENPPAPPAGI
jgi:hypothetical protein